jgi:hypothetical protein
MALNPNEAFEKDKLTREYTGSRDGMITDNQKAAILTGIKQNNISWSTLCSGAFGFVIMNMNNLSFTEAAKCIVYIGVLQKIDIENEEG